MEIIQLSLFDYKTCSCCGQSLPIGEFRYRGKKDPNRHGQCRACLAAKQHAWYESNHDLQMQRRKAWREQNAEKIKEAKRQYHIRNKDRIREKVDKWRLDNLDRVRERQRRKYARDKSTFVVVNERRRAAKRSTGSDLTTLQWQLLVDACDNRCLRCGASGVTQDHIIPLSRGGKHTITNVQPLCGPCNNIKWAKTEDHRPDWIRQFCEDMKLW